MAKAYDVAQYFLHLAANEDEPELLTHLRLQKLLYYAQAWSLAIRNQPMFDGRIEAWAHGPVVRELYSRFCDYGCNAIPPAGESGAGLSEDETEFVGAVWDSYKVYSASSLREMTHKEDPWIDARKGYGPSDRCEEEITHDAMRRYFAPQVAVV